MRTITKGKSFTVILSDGTVITDTNASQDTIEFVKKNSQNEEEIKNFFMCSHDEKEDIKEKRELVKEVTSSPIFEYDETTGITSIPTISNVSLPDYLIKKINEETSADKLEGYLNFWRLACRNPNEASRNNLLWFLNTHNFNILKSGLFVAYRNVVKVQNGAIYANLYENVKKVQKKSPKKFKVVKTADANHRAVKLDYKLKNGEIEVGNLKELYDNSANDTHFTDKHTRKFKIQLGTPVNMDRDKCDTNPNNTCSSGLHIACKDWSGLSGFGDTTIAVLVNPIDVVAVPVDAGYSKMRVCQYFPLKVVEWSNGKIVDNIQDGDDLNYWDAIIEGEVNNDDSTPHVLKVPEMPTVEYTNYIVDINKIRNTLKNKLLNK